MKAMKGCLVLTVILVAFWPDSLLVLLLLGVAIGLLCVAIGTLEEEVVEGKPKRALELWRKNRRRNADER